MGSYSESMSDVSPSIVESFDREVHVAIRLIRQVNRDAGCFGRQQTDITNIHRVADLVAISDA